MDEDADIPTYGSLAELPDNPTRAELVGIRRYVDRERTRRESDSRATNDLKGFEVWEGGVTADDLVELEQVLASADNEQTMQRFLEDHPELLIQHLGGGHGRWVIPHQRLGSEHVTDFMIGEKSSLGFEWQAVELESPRARCFTKKGDPAAALTHAIRQIGDWRNWISKNQPYADRPREKGGFGLRDIDSEFDGLIIIGRRKDEDAGIRERRRTFGRKLGITIHSYDWLLDMAQAAVARAGGRSED